MQGAELTTADTAFTIIVVSSIIVVGGWIIVHRTALMGEREKRSHELRLEKESRRAELLSALKYWEYTFVVQAPDAERDLYYREGRRALAAAELFRCHVVNGAVFDKLNERVSSLGPDDFEAGGPGQEQEAVCSAIRQLHAFVRSA